MNGYGFVNGTCTLCPSGQYSSGAQMACTACPNNCSVCYAPNNTNNTSNTNTNPEVQQMLAT